MASFRPPPSDGLVSRGADNAAALVAALRNFAEKSEPGLVFSSFFHSFSMAEKDWESELDNRPVTNCSSSEPECKENTHSSFSNDDFNQNYESSGRGFGRQRDEKNDRGSFNSELADLSSQVVSAQTGPSDVPFFGLFIAPVLHVFPGGRGWRGYGRRGGRGGWRGYGRRGDNDFGSRGFGRSGGSSGFRVSRGYGRRGDNDFGSRGFGRSEQLSSYSHNPSTL
ncbi:uncharacterized protein LOC143783139 isoform X2 [Ranitomeya variabilis]|uniref:uncharacterized protein LOC143783139 isoform X2 n=1 Tax=Ranitomeya variabilis TaxID=490064 RepID=UPI0040568EE7